MTDPAGWEEGNGRYLSAALRWLRLRLERRARQERPATTEPAAQPEHGAKRQTAASIAEQPRDETFVPADTDELAHATEEVDAAESRMDPPPALGLLGRRLGLSRFERDVLLLCSAMELDTRVATLCARAQGDPSRCYPTFALALSLFDAPAWDVLSPDRPLRYWRLIEISQQNGQPLTTSTLHADERIVNYLKGLNYLDGRLASLVAPLRVDGGETELPSSQHAVVESVLLRCRQEDGPLAPVVQLLGPDAPSKQAVAWYAAARCGLRLYRLPSEALPTNALDLETLSRLWGRESILLPIALYIDAQELDNATEAAGQSLRRFLARCDGLLFLGTRERWSCLGRADAALDVNKPTPAEQRTAWTAALGAAGQANPGRLAGQFDLNVATIRQIAKTVLAERGDEETSLNDRLWDACQAALRPRLNTLAQRLDLKSTWDDIILPDEQVGLLRQIARQVDRRTKVYEEWGFRSKMNRGLGISALFAGDSGTGKTMAAEVIANELRLNLYRIDLSGVVSKYIGETEKNLRRLFDAAEEGGAILFFDEADALFGKRSEVKDSHDRYANIEINYLLQRMEGYRGLAILATNMRSALDHAFLRRLRFIIHFPIPGFGDRRLIWQKVFPRETPVSGLDFDRLAHFDLTGGSIHNIALAAAFLAASDAGVVNMTHLLHGTRQEYQKMGKVVMQGDFR